MLSELSPHASRTSLLSEIPIIHFPHNTTHLPFCNHSKRNSPKSQDILQIPEQFLSLFLPHRFLHIQHFHLHILIPELNRNNIPFLHIGRSLSRLIINQNTPQSQASLATVRLLISRDTFKYLSNLIIFLLRFFVPSKYILYFLLFQPYQSHFPQSHHTRKTQTFHSNYNPALSGIIRHSPALSGIIRHFQDTVSLIIL